MTESQQPNQSWIQRTSEPDIWYARFLVYRDLGVTRTVEAAFKKCKEQDEAITASRPGGVWYAASKHHNWAERANQWDIDERERIGKIEEQRRFEKREYRIGVIEDVLTKILLVIELAQLPNLEVSTARDMMPIVRMMLKDLLTMHRSEVGDPGNKEPQPETATLITAEDLIEAQRQLAQRAGNGNATTATIGDNAENVVMGQSNEQTINKGSGPIVNIYTQPPAK